MTAAADSEQRTGVLVIRAWIERDGPDGFRARVTSTLDLTSDREQVSVAATMEDTLAIVERWIDNLIGP